MNEFPQIKEIKCRTILSKSGIEGIDYTINPYIGCQHACRYCYAQYMWPWRNIGLKWGKHIFVKVNALERLNTEIHRIKPWQVVELSSVTDPYQPIERKYQLTRRILEKLLNNNVKTIILTKSNLVTRDIDIMLENSRNLQVGLTIITLDEHFKRAFEPYSPSVKERLSALEKLSRNGIVTFCFIGPMLPVVTDESLWTLIDVLENIGVKMLIFDRMNVKWGLNKHLLEIIGKNFPDLYELYEKVFTGGDYWKYYKSLKNDILNFCEGKSFKVVFCY
ncbi:radical SAM protein [archaeon]|nr:MAG: radical SAM protein [archaeon]